MAPRAGLDPAARRSCLDALAGHELRRGPARLGSARAEALLCAPMMPVDAAAIAAMPALRAIAVAGAGTDAIDLARPPRAGSRS